MKNKMCVIKVFRYNIKVSHTSVQDMDFPRHALMIILFSGCKVLGARFFQTISRLDNVSQVKEHS